jgi:gp6-like head-tail connector protein
MHSILEILEESTASAGPDLISLDDLKLALGIEGSTEDAALQAAITHQSRIIAEYCDRRLGLASVLETFKFDPAEYLPAKLGLPLSLYPVVDIFEVSIAGATGANYHFDPASGRLWLSDLQDYGFSYYWNASYGNWPGVLQVTYSGGYDLPENAPARLQQAIIEAISTNRTSGTRDPTIREVQHGDTRITYMSPAFTSGSTGHLTASVVDLIKPFRRLHVA